MSIYVARQPIFDGKERLAGYELLYRHDATRTWADGVDGDTMSARVISNAFLGIGIQELTGGVPGFVNFSREQLVSGAHELLDPSEVVVELLESIRCDEETLRVCEAMHSAGYRYALDDFVYDESFDPMLAMASIVKLDVLNREEADIRAALVPLKGFKGALLAERVETEAIHKSCAAMGFSLFQGYFYARPETVTKEDLEAGQVTILRLLVMLRNPDVSDAELDAALRGDPTLCYKLLRIVNSASMGGRGIESIQHALRMVGRAKLRRWLAVIFAASFAVDGGASAEVAQVTLARARMCELLAQTSKKSLDADALFMTGMMSMMDALMRVPMTRVLELVEVAPEVRDALLHRAGAQAPALRLVEAYERGEWKELPSLSAGVGVDEAVVGAQYVAAVAWAREQMSTSAS